VLEYDRPISSPTDMTKAKLLRMELVSERTDSSPTRRRSRPTPVMASSTSPTTSVGRPDKHILLRTRGPVFYLNPKGVADAGTGPDIWTDAPVEVIDRSNLPRGFGATAPQTAPAPGEDTRRAAAVADILTGHRLPPPTVTAVGLRIFLEPEKPAVATPTADAREEGLHRVQWRPPGRASGEGARQPVGGRVASRS